MFEREMAARTAALARGETFLNLTPAVPPFSAMKQHAYTRACPRGGGMQSQLGVTWDDDETVPGRLLSVLIRDAMALGA